jgi:hypothetical protein
MLHTEVHAKTPEQAVELFKTALLYAPSLKDVVDSIELDEDHPPTRIAVSLSEPKDDGDFNVLVKEQENSEVGKFWRKP